MRTIFEEELKRISEFETELAHLQQKFLYLNSFSPELLTEAVELTAKFEKEFSIVERKSQIGVALEIRKIRQIIDPESIDPESIEEKENRQQFFQMLTIEQKCYSFLAKSCSLTNELFRLMLTIEQSN